MPDGQLLRSSRILCALRGLVSYEETVTAFHPPPTATLVNRSFKRYWDTRTFKLQLLVFVLGFVAILMLVLHAAVERVRGKA